MSALAASWAYGCSAIWASRPQRRRSGEVALWRLANEERYLSAPDAVPPQLERSQTLFPHGHRSSVNDIAIYDTWAATASKDTSIKLLYVR